MLPSSLKEVTISFQLNHDAFLVIHKNLTLHRILNLNFACSIIFQYIFIAIIDGSKEYYVRPAIKMQRNTKLFTKVVGTKEPDFHLLPYQAFFLL